MSLALRNGRGSRSRRRPRCEATLIGVSSLLLSAGAAAQGSVQEVCVAAHADGQTLRIESKLIAAKERFTSCAQATCPPLVQTECAALLAEVDAMLPSLVITAKDAARRDLRDVRTTLDGRALGDALDGKAVIVDPGPHRLHAERRGSRPVALDIIVAQGEKNRRVVIEFPAPAPRAPTSPAVSDEAQGGGVSPLVWIGFGIGGAGLIVGAITGGITLAETSELKEQCPGNVCTEEQRPDFDRALILSRVSTVALAVGGAGALVGIVGLFLPTSDEPDQKRAGAHVTPLVGPGWLALRGWL